MSGDAAAIADRGPVFRHARRWTWAALALFVLALVPIALPVIEGGPREVVPIFDDAAGDRENRRERWHAATMADLRFVVWQTARNARTLLTQPTRLFDGEMCYPAKSSLAFGPSGISIGVLGIPAQLFTDDPVLTYNFVVLALLLLSALAMYQLVREWTGVPPAGLAAGMIYTFHYLKVGDLIHLYVRDSLWIVLALLFARRLFATRRWRDATGLALSGLMLLGGSLYPMLAALLIAPVFAGWLLRTYGLKALRPAQLAMVASVVALGVWILIGPYLGLSDEGQLGQSKFHIFPPAGLFAPGHPGFPGYGATALLIAGLALPAALVSGPGERTPRWPLLFATGILISASVLPAADTPSHIVIVERGAALPGAWPNLYLALEQVLPGLDLGRGPGAIYLGAHMLIAVLAGFGVAAIVRRMPARAQLAGAIAVVLLVSIETTRIPALGFDPPHAFATAPIRPAATTLAIYDEIARNRPDAAILEIPGGFVRINLVARSVLLSAYHQRPTSQCYSPYAPEVVRRVQRLSRLLPDATALAELRALGFGSLVVRRGGGDERDGIQLQRLREFAEGEGRHLLRPIGENEALSAYLFVAPDGS
jgi:hypothetical protein